MYDKVKGMKEGSLPKMDTSATAHPLFSRGPGVMSTNKKKKTIVEFHGWNKFLFPSTFKFIFTFTERVH